MLHSFHTDISVDTPAVPALDTLMDDPNEDEDLIPSDTRRVTRLLDSLVQPEGELSDSDDEGEGKRRNHASTREEDDVIGADVGGGTDSAPPASERAISEADSRVASSTAGEAVVAVAATTAKAPTGILIPGGLHPAAQNITGVVPRESTIAVPPVEDKDTISAPMDVDEGETVAAAPVPAAPAAVPEPLS
jgi:hypothetical protein